MAHRAVTSTGVWLLVFEPLPSWPFPLLPQHFSACVFVMAQVCQPPTVMAVIALVRPVTSTGRLLSAVELFPSWPSPFGPQHLTAPACVSAQLWLGLKSYVEPTARAVTPSSRPETSTGLSLSVLEPSRARPRRLCPSI